MNRRPPTLPLLLLTLLLPTLSTAVPAGSESDCPVSIAIDSDRYSSSHDVRVRLIFDGVDTVHLPMWLPRSVRVQRLGEPPAFDAPPRSSRRPAKEIRPLRTVPYTLADPWPLDIRWMDVAEWGEDSTFDVSAGLYRLRFVYAPVAPSKRDEDVLLCTVYSPVFTLDSDSKWRYLTD